MLARRTLIHAGITIAAFVIIIISVELYFKHRSYYPSTDDAYLQANAVKVASLVAGEIGEVNVTNNQTVQKGQLLFSLNTKPFLLEESASNAQLNLVQQKLSADKTAILSAQESLKKAKIEVAELKKNMNTINDLVAHGYASKIDGEIATAKYKGGEAEYKAAEYKVLEAERAVGHDKVNPAVKEAQAAYDGAQFKLEHASYHAPVAGTIVNLKLQKGEVVGAGMPLFVLIEDGSFWVEANFTEDKLQRMYPGQSATIKINMYPDITLHGTVETINHSSGSSFSLLPSQNASGNWVKISQRFPVKIKLNTLPDGKVLRVGSSCSVTVDTKHG